VHARTALGLVVVGGYEEKVVVHHRHAVRSLLLQHNAITNVDTVSANAPPKTYKHTKCAGTITRRRGSPKNQPANATVVTAYPFHAQQETITNATLHGEGADKRVLVRRHRFRGRRPYQPLTPGPRSSAAEKQGGPPGSGTTRCWSTTATGWVCRYRRPIPTPVGS
jgi:hypothetical protein